MFKMIKKKCGIALSALAQKTTTVKEKTIITGRKINK